MAGQQKLWGGRFTESTNPALESLNSSLRLDQRLYAEDIDGSKAYARALENINLLSHQEADAICRGLDVVKDEWRTGIFEIKDGDEDIHTANERRLLEIIGPPAAKLHTGRSRNDQSTTDTKLWLKRNLKTLESELRNLIKVMVARASKEGGIIMPGYTHLQRAQPVRWAHFILSHAWSFKKDCERLEDLLKRINVLPLGGGALAGNPFDVDRIALAAALGFAEVTENSIQTVGDRDFVAEFLFWASLVGSHLSRLAEDLIVYSTKEFEFVTVSEAYSTGSSLMPQKRNADSLELIRGEGSGLFGKCCSFMMILKGLPSSYNKDLQSDKDLIFSTFDKLKLLLEVIVGVLVTIRVNEDKCRSALSCDMLATDVAYYLVKKGLPFRQSHHLAGQVVLLAEKKGVAMADLTLVDLKGISDNFGEDFGAVWNYENSVEQYQADGGTAKSSVEHQINVLELWLQET